MAAAAVAWSALAIVTTGLARTGALGLHSLTGITGVGVGRFVGALLPGLLLCGAYARPQRGHRSSDILAGACLGALLILGSALPTIPARIDPWSALVATALTAALAFLAVRAARSFSHRIVRDVWPGPRHAAPALVIGHDPATGSAEAQALSAVESEYRMVGRVTIGRVSEPEALGSLDALPRLIEQHRIETLIVGEHLGDHQLRTLLELSVATGCELLYPARSVEIAGVRPTLVWHQDHAFFELGAPVLKPPALVIKRLLDLVGSVVALVLLLPMLALIALAIKLDSPGPVLFYQDRAGLGGRRFRMLKFRTMRVGADSEKDDLAHLNSTGDVRLFKIYDDPRVTRLGAFLRRWSIDELPQLWNVLVGDMSLVGPRPFFESDFAMYEDHHFRRLDAKPGITGLWQVNGRSAVVNFEEVVRLDRLYIESWSLGLDLRIMCRTVPTVFRRTGAY